MKHTLRSYISMAVLLGGIIAFDTGCKSNKLEEGGAYAPGLFLVSTNASGAVVTNFSAAYAPDLAFYVADGAFSVAYATADTVFTFERNNRDMLWRLSPDIKKVLDGIRPQAVEVRNKYIAARTAYLQTPTPAGLSAMNEALSRMNNLAAAASAALPKK